MRLRISNLHIYNWNDNYYRTVCWSDMRSNGSDTRCKSGWSTFAENKCGQWSCRGSTTNWKYRHCWRYHNFLINIGSQTQWHRQVNINVRANDSTNTNGRSNGCSGNTMRFTCDFDVNPGNANATLIRILHSHMLAGRLSPHDYNNFMRAFLFTNTGKSYMYSRS